MQLVPLNKLLPLVPGEVKRFAAVGTPDEPGIILFNQFVLLVRQVIRAHVLDNGIQDCLVEIEVPVDFCIKHDYLF